MAITLNPTTGTGYCEHGEHEAPACEITPGSWDPAMGRVWIDSICDDCLDAQVAAYYG